MFKIYSTDLEKNKLKKTQLLKTDTLEIAGLATTLIIFLVINLLTVDKFPCVSQDEVMFTDPAANLYLGHGLTSSAWFFQDRQEFWAGNLPLYSLLIFCWMKLFGFSVMAVRSLNYFLAIASGAVLWLAIVRFQFLKLPLTRILAVATVLSGYGVGICYATGRYDALNILFASLALLFCSLPSAKLRYGLLGIMGILMVFSGIHLVIFAALTCLTLLLFVKTKYFFESLSLAIGMLLGLGLTFAYFYFNGVWSDFLTSAEYLKSLTEGSLPKDPSLPFVYMAAFLLLIKQFFSKRLQWQSLLTYSVTLGLVVPVIMLALGRFPTYYTWIVYIPLVIGIFSVLEKIKAPQKSLVAQATVSLLLVASFMGLPLQKASALNYWQDRDYARVENFIQQHVSPENWVYTEFGAYYATKQITDKVFVPTYLGAMSNADKSKIDTLVIDPKNVEDVQAQIGGNWQEMSYALVPQRDKFLIFKGNFGDKLVENYNFRIWQRVQE